MDDPYSYSWEDEDATLDNPYEWDDSGLFEESNFDFGGFTAQSLQNYSNFQKDQALKNSIDPLAKFKQSAETGFSSTRQPHTQRAFREYEAWKRTGDDYDDQEKEAKDIQGYYKGNLDTFYDKHVLDHYKKVFGVSPDSDDNYDRVVSHIDKHYKSNPGLDPGNEGMWGRIKKGYDKVNNEFVRADEQFNVSQEVNTDFKQKHLEVDPAFKRAFENHSKINKATKGRSTGAHSTEELNEFLSRWDIGTTGDEAEDAQLAQVYGGINWKPKQLPDQKLENPFEKILGEADFSALMEEHRRGEWLPGNGFTIPPSRNGKIADISTRLRSRERGRLLLRKARDAGYTHFLDEEGNRVSIDDNYFEFEDYDEEDDQRLMALDNYFKAKGDHNAALMEFFANRSSMSPDEQEKAIEKNHLLNQLTQEHAIQLEALGMIDEAANRSESLEEIGRLGSWWKTGALQAEASEVAKGLTLTGGQLNPSTWQQLVNIVQQQDDLEEYKQKKGYSALAEIQKMSAAEGDEGWLDAIGKWFGNPEAFIQTGVESLASLLPAYLDTAPAVIGAGTATGAVAGIWTGPGVLATAGTGAAWGARINYGVASGLLEATGKIIEGLRELGIDPENPQHYAAAWANEEIRSELRTKALKKGVPIAMFDALSAGVAGKVAGVVKTPSTLKKIPSVLPGGKKYYKGLNDKASDELMELKKLGKAKKLDETGTARLAELDELRKANLGLGGHIKPVESALGRSIRKSNETVHRYTKMDRAKNAGLEMGAQMAFGGMGEATGQLWSREPGDPIDKHAIIGEVAGELGGIGSFTSAIEIAGHGGKFWKKPGDKDMRGTAFETVKSQEVVPEEGQAYGRQGVNHTINRAGWQHNAFEPATATDATAFIAEQANVPIKITNPDPAKAGEEIVNPKLQAMNDYIAGVMELVNRSPANSVKLVVTDRTPVNTKGVGYVEMDKDTNDFYMYLNPEAAAERGDDIFGAAIHEFPHIVGKAYYGDEQVLAWYNELGDAQRKQALAHYVFKDERAHQDFTKEGALSPDDIKKLNEVKGRLSVEEQAQEWFSFEFARALFGQMYDKAEKVTLKKKTVDGQEFKQDLYSALPEGEYNNILQLLDQYIAQPYQKYIGSGVRRQTPHAFGKGVENLPGVYQVDENIPGKGPAVSSEVSLKPEKMGDKEMYAKILDHMQWQVTPDQQLVYQGPDIEPAKQPLYETDMGRLVDQRNLLLGTAKTRETLAKIAGGLPKGTLSVTLDERGELVYDERGKPYQAEATDTRSKAQVEEFVDEEMEYQSRLDQEAPSQPAGRLREAQTVEDSFSHEPTSAKYTPAKSDALEDTPGEWDREYKKREGKKLESGYAPRDDVGEGLGIDDKTKKRAKTRMMATSGLEPVEDITKKMDTLYDKLSKKGMSSEQIMATPDMKRLVEKRSASRPQEKKYDEVIEQSIKAKEADATVEPLQTRTPRRTHVVKEDESMSSIAKKYEVDLNELFSLNRMATTDAVKKGQKLVIPTKFKDELSPEGRAQRAITDLEFRRKKFQEKHGDKTPEQQVEALYKLLKSNDDSFVEQTKDVLQKLKDEKGRVTSEEFIAELARSYGLDDMADTFAEARSKLSDKSDLGSIEEAYYAAEDKIESVVEQLNLAESDIKEKIKSTELDLKVAQGQKDNINTRLPVKEEEVTGKDGKKFTKKTTAEYLTDDQVSSVVGSIQKIIGQEGVENVGNLIEIVSPQNRKVFTEGLQSLVKEYGKGSLKYLNSKTRLNTGDPEKDAALDNMLKPLRAIINKGAIKSVTKYKGSEKEAAKAEKRLKTLQGRLKKIQSIRSSVGVGSLTQNIDWRSQPVTGQTLFNATVKEGDDYRALTLGDLAKSSNKDLKIYTKNKDGSQKQWTITNRQQRLKQLIEEELSPENMAKWGSTAPGKNHTYGDFAIALLHAGASMREGDISLTQHGTSEKPYFEAEVGSNILGALVTRVEVMRKNLNQLTEKEIQDRSKNDEEQRVLRDFVSMQRYESAFDEQYHKAVEARENAVSSMEEQRKQILDLSKVKGKPNKLQSLKLVIKEAESKELSDAQKSILSEIKEYSKTTPGKKTKPKAWIQNRETGELELKDDPKALGALKTTPLTINDFLAFKGLSEEAIKAEENKEAPLPSRIAAADRILINIAATQMSYDWFARDSSKVGKKLLYDRFRNDYELTLEGELEANIDHLQQIVDTGKSAAKVALHGDYFLPGEIFRVGSQIRKAKQKFKFIRTLDPFLLNEVSVRVDTPLQEEGMVKLNKVEMAQVKQMLESAKKVRDRYNLHMFGMEDSDIMSAQPKINFDDGTPVTFTHWARNLAEKRWEEGPKTADKPFGGYKPTERPNYGDFNRPASHKDPHVVDQAWEGTSKTRDWKGRDVFHNMTQAEYDAFQERLKNKKVTKKDLRMLRELQTAEAETAIQELTAHNVVGGSISRQVAHDLQAEIAKVKEAIQELPPEIQRELNYDEILDKPINVAQRFIAAVIAGRSSIPESLRSLRIEGEDGKTYVETDIKKILSDKKLRTLFEQQNKFLANFDFHYDNLESKSDPTIRAMNTIEQNDIVKSALEKESRERSAKERAGHVTKLTPKQLEAVATKAALLKNEKGQQAVDKLIKSGKSIVYSQDVSQFRQDRRPQYRKLSSPDQLYNAKKGDRFVLYVSKDGQVPEMHKVLVTGDPRKIKSFDEDFRVAEEYSNLPTYLENKKIIKIEGKLEENPMGYVSAYGSEARGVIAEKRATHKRMQATFEDKDIQANFFFPGDEQLGSKGISKTEYADRIVQFEKQIDEAEKFIDTKGKEGKFEFIDVKAVAGYLHKKVDGGWATDEGQGYAKPVPKEAQRALDQHYLEEALNNYEAFQDELNQPMASVQNLSSFVVTPRKLGQFLADQGLNSVSMLAGSHSMWKAETRGGIELLQFLPEVVDELLDSLSKVSEDKRNRLAALTKAHEGTPTGEVLERYLERFNERSERLKDLPVSTQVLLDHIATNMENANRREEKPKFLSDADLKVAESMHRKDKKIFSVAISQGEPPVFGSKIVNLGTYEETSESAAGKKFTVKKTMRALMTPHFVDKKTKAPIKVSQEHYNKKKATSREEGVDAVDANFNKVSKSRNINIEPVSARWPVNEANKEEKLGAYVYDIKFLNSEEEVSSAYLDQTRNTYNRLTATQRESMEKFYNDVGELKVAHDPKTGEYLPGAQRKAAEFTQAMAAAREQEDLIASIFESSSEHNIPKDIRTKKVKYGKETRGIDLQQAKLRTLGRLVWDAGGIQTFSAEDVRLAEKQVESDAEQYRTANDQANMSAEDLDSYNVAQGVTESVSDAELLADLEDLEANMDNLSKGSTFWGSSFEEQSPGFISKLASTLGFKNKRLIDRVRQGEDPHGEEFFKNRDGFMGTNANLHQLFAEQFVALEDSHDAISKALGYEPTSDEGEKMNIYSEAYATMGRTGEMMDVANREFVDPIAEAIHKTGVDKGVLGKYLIAEVTPQANKAIAANREALGLEPLLHNGKQAGSGMTNEDAEALKKELLQDKALENFINHKDNPLEKIFGMHEKTLDYAAESQMLDGEQYKKMKAAATDEKGRFRRIPLKGMHWLDGDQWEQDQAIADKLGGESRAEGKGFDQPKKTSFYGLSVGRKYGSYADPNAMLEHVQLEHSNAVIRSQRAKPALKLLEVHNRLKEARNKDPKSFAGRLYNRLFDEVKELEKHVYAEVEDADGNVVHKLKTYTIPAEMSDTKRLFYARKLGKPVVIKFAKTTEGAALADAMKNLSHEQMGSFMEALSWTTQGMGKIVTKWNPEFWLRNPIRDTSAAWFNLGDSATGKKVRKEVLAITSPKKFAAQVKAIAKFERHLSKHGKLPKGLEGELTPENLDRERVKNDPLYAYHAMKTFGGKTAFYVFKSVDKLIKDMEKKIRRGKKGSTWTLPFRYVNEIVEHINTAMENSYRVRTFAEFIAAGEPIERAIREARNVTVDFNKRGQWGRQLGAFVMFANPSIQGTKRFVKGWERRSPADRAKVGMQIFSTAFAWNLIARALSERDDEEEDDGSTYYDDRGNQKNYTSIGIPMDMFFDSPQGRHFDLPLDFAWTPITGMASVMAKHVYHHGNDKYEPNLIQDIMEYVEYSTTAIAPIPTSTNIIPAAQPFVDVWRNKKDFGGMPVYNEGTFYAPAASPEQMSTRKTSQAMQDLAKAINSMGGGDKYRPGNWAHVAGRFFGFDVDSNMDLKDSTFKMGPMVSGSVMEYLLEKYAGGMGELALDMTDMVFYAKKPDKKIPLVNAVFKNKTSDWPTVGRFYQLVEKNRQVERSEREWAETNQRQVSLNYNKKYPQAKKLSQLMKSSNKNLSAIRRMKDSVENNKNLTEDQKMQRLDDIEKKRINTMRQALVKAHKFGIAI